MLPQTLRNFLLCLNKTRSADLTSCDWSTFKINWFYNFPAGGFLMLCHGLVIQFINNSPCAGFLSNKSPYLWLSCVRNWFKQLYCGNFYDESGFQQEIMAAITDWKVEDKVIFFSLAGRACHRFWCCSAHGPVWSGIRWLHAEPSFSSGCNHQRVRRPHGARLQTTKTGLMRGKGKKNTPRFTPPTAPVLPHTQTV